MPPNLAFWNGSDEAHGHTDGDVHNADDPKHLAVLSAVVSEYNGEDDASEVSRRAGEAGYDSYDHQQQHEHAEVRQWLRGRREPEVSYRLRVGGRAG